MSERLHPSDFLTEFELLQARDKLQAAVAVFERHYAAANLNTSVDSSVGMLSFTKDDEPALESRELEVRFINGKVARITLFDDSEDGFTAYFTDGAFQDLDKIDATKLEGISRKDTSQLLKDVDSIGCMLEAKT